MTKLVKSKASDIKEKDEEVRVILTNFISVFLILFGKPLF
jgi:hypothetical protein